MNEISIKLLLKGRQAAKRPKMTQPGKHETPGRAENSRLPPTQPGRGWQVVGTETLPPSLESRAALDRSLHNFPRPGIVFGGDRCWEVNEYECGGERRRWGRGSGSSHGYQGDTAELGPALTSEASQPKAKRAWLPGGGNRERSSDDPGLALIGRRPPPPNGLPKVDQQRPAPMGLC